MIETQTAQIAAAIPINHSGKIPGQPENSPKLFMQLQSNRGGEVLPMDYKCRALAEGKSVVIF